MKNLLAISVLVVLTGCAQTQWTHPTKSQAQFQMDSAYCQNESMRSVQQQAASPVVPAYIPPAQYDTNCYKVGNNLNCSTTSQGNYGAQLAQQNAQNMAQAGANIGTGIARQQFAENCMLSMGYSKQAITSAGSNEINQKAQLYNSELKSMGEEYKLNVCTSENLKPIFAKTPCNTADIGLAQLSDNTKISESDKPIFEQLIKINQAYQARELLIIEKYVVPPLRDSMLVMVRRQYNEAFNGHTASLYKGDITWGDFNKARSLTRIKISQERSELLNKFK